MLTKLKKDKGKFFLLLLFVVVVIAVVKIFGLASLLSPTYLREKILGYGPLAPLMFLLIYSVATIFFLPGTPVTIAGGLIFGKFLGTVYTVIGATIGATIAFLIARFLGESFVENLLKGKHKKIYEYDKKIEKNGFLVVLFLRLIPLFPFNALNFTFGLTKVKLKDYVLGTLIGIIPGSFVLAYFGDSLASLSVINIVIASLLFAAMAFIPTIYNRYKKIKSTKIEQL